MLRVTFDANTLDKVVRPERFPKDHQRNANQALHEAIRAGRIAGFFSATLATLEGIRRDLRAHVFGSSRLATQLEHGPVENGVGVSIINVSVAQERDALPTQMTVRFGAAIDLGFRVLKAARIGMPPVEDPHGNIHAAETEADAWARFERFNQAASAIEARGLGSVPAQRLADALRIRAGHSTRAVPWFADLGLAKDKHERAQVSRAIAEWSDGDSIAAHVGYAIDYFCTHDMARRAGGPSAMDGENRRWLWERFGVRFITLVELAALVDQSPSLDPKLRAD
jgi:hypothetical protein